MASAHWNYGSKIIHVSHKPTENGWLEKETVKLSARKLRSLRRAIAHKPRQILVPPAKLAGAQYRPADTTEAGVTCKVTERSNWQPKFGMPRALDTRLDVIY